MLLTFMNAYFYLEFITHVRLACPHEWVHSLLCAAWLAAKGNTVGQVQDAMLKEGCTAEMRPL